MGTIKSKMKYHSVDLEEMTEACEDIDIEANLSQYGYITGKTLGAGTFGVVKTVFKKGHTKCLAVKIMDPKRGKIPLEAFKQTMHRELAILKTVKHEHIISIESVIEINRFVCVIMERIDRGSVEEMILNNGAFSTRRARMIFRELLDAVCYLHSRRIAHRDLKCENMLLDDVGSVKLIDFGFARCCLATDPIFTNRHLSETYLGSPAYAAPELLMNIPYDPLAADMWSMGVLLFRLLSADYPFKDRRPREIVDKQLARNWTFPVHAKMLNGITASCEQVVGSLLDPDMVKRSKSRDVYRFDWMKY